MDSGQSIADRIRDRCGPRAETKLAQDIRGVIRHRAWADNKPIGDLLIGQAVRHEPQHVQHPDCRSGLSRSLVPAATSMAPTERTCNWAGNGVGVGAG